MTKMLLGSLLVATLVSHPALARGDDSKPEQPIATNLEQKSSLTDGELAVLAHVRHVNQMEIDMGTLVKKQSTNKYVRAYGRMLVMDHTRALKDLDAFVKANKVTLPADKPKNDAEAKDMQASMDAMARLKTLKGAAFDRELVPLMAAEHDKEIAKLDAAMTTITNPKLKTLLQNTRPVLQKHADQARDLSQSGKIAAPE